MVNKTPYYFSLLRTSFLVCCCFMFSCNQANTNQKDAVENSNAEMKEVSSSVPVSAVADTLTVDPIAIGWAGVYRGELPCADCAGIQTEIKLKRNGSFSLVMKYEGKDAEPFKEEGKIIRKPNNIIELDEGNGHSQKYLVEKDQLVQLDLSGNRIKGKLADAYILHKD